MDPLDGIEGEDAATAVSTDDAVSGSAGEHQEHEQDVLSTFKLEDVDEAYREDVERYVKQANGDYTRKTQALARERQELAARQAELEIISRLESEESRNEALAELLGRYGYALPEDEEDEEGTDEEDYFRDPRVDALQAQLAEQQAAQQQAKEAEQQEAFNARVMEQANAELESWRERLGAEALHEDDKFFAYTGAGSLPRGEDGMPDVKGAIARLEARDARVIQRYLQSKKPENPTPDLGGHSGADTFDPRDPRARLAHANAVAERALARHA